MKGFKKVGSPRVKKAGADFRSVTSKRITRTPKKPPKAKGTKFVISLI
jgi:hypothetical protein